MSYQDMNPIGTCRGMANDFYTNCNFIKTNTFIGGEVGEQEGVYI